MVNASNLDQFDMFYSETLPTCLEGFFLKGDALDLKSKSGCHYLADFLFMDRRCSDLRDVQHFDNDLINGKGRTRTRTRVENDLNKSGCVYPPGSPANILTILAQSPVTQIFTDNSDQIYFLMKHLPIFLTETKAHNALWLSRLVETVDVQIYVERMAPVIAKIKWMKRVLVNIIHWTFLMCKLL